MPESDATSSPPSRVSSPTKNGSSSTENGATTVTDSQSSTSKSPSKNSADSGQFSNSVLQSHAKNKTGPGSSKQPRNSSPKKISFNLNELPANLSTYIQELAASTANFSSGKKVGAPMQQVTNSASPRKPFNLSNMEFGQRRQEIPPLKDEEGALKWFYHGLSSAEHTSLIDFYSFLTEKLPALFSQLKSNGQNEMHDTVQRIQLFIRTFNIISRVHRSDNFVVEVCQAALKFLGKAEKVISIHSLLPGLGDQCVALIERSEVGFLVGPDEQKSAVSILLGCRRSCSNEFSLSGNSAASWRSHNKKRQHSRANKEGADSKGGEKKRFDKSKKPKNPKFTGEN